MNRLSLVRVGAFSGSALSLRDALAQKVATSDFDLLTVARRPGMWGPRVRAYGEAALANDRVPFSKTAAWSRGLQRALPTGLDSDPMLFVQTTPAFDLAPGTRYGIYTDRLGLEGMHASDPYRSRATKGWARRERVFVQRAERLFVMGPSSMDVAISEYGIPPERVLVVGGAPNAPIGELRRSTSCRRVLFIGVDWQRKGLVDLLAAFSRVRLSHNGLTLDVIGGSPDGLDEEGVTIVGRVPHTAVIERLSRADLVVIPTYNEPFGIALVEALMMGIPVIGTTTGNQPWIIGEGGVTVTPGDVDALTTAMMNVVETYPTLKARAEKRRIDLLSTMTWDVIADRILDEMARMVDQESEVEP